MAEKKPQIAVVWDEEKKAAWEKLAADFKMLPAVLAREVLDEFMACYLSEEEIGRLGMKKFLGVRSRVYLESALINAQRQAGRGELEAVLAHVNSEKKEERGHGGKRRKRGSGT